jgi:ribosomal protein L39E
VALLISFTNPSGDAKRAAHQVKFTSPARNRETQRPPHKLHASNDPCKTQAKLAKLDEQNARLYTFDTRTTRNVGCCHTRTHFFAPLHIKNLPVLVRAKTTHKSRTNQRLQS